MTNPPQSPYGPSDPSQQPAYGQPPMFHPPQVPYGYTVVGPIPPKRSNGPGLAALILGIVSVVLAFIPLVNIFAFFTGTAGIIVGIIGLVLADRPRKQAAWGTGLSAASMVLAFLMFFVYTFGFIFAVGGAIEESTRNLPTYEATPLPSETLTPITPAVEPLALGTVVQLSDTTGEPAFDATVSASVLDATDAVMAVAGNPDAPAGFQWAMVTVDVTSRSDAAYAPAVDVVVEFVTEDGEVFNRLDAFAIAPEPQFDALFDLGEGESGSGNIAIAIPTDAVDSGQWILSHADAVDDSERFYFETS